MRVSAYSCLVSGRGDITRVPQREQKAELAAASNPHWGHLMIVRYRTRFGRVAGIAAQERHSELWIRQRVWSIQMSVSHGGMVERFHHETSRTRWSRQTASW